MHVEREELRSIVRARDGEMEWCSSSVIVISLYGDSTRARMQENGCAEADTEMYMEMLEKQSDRHTKK